MDKILVLREFHYGGGKTDNIIIDCGVGGRAESMASLNPEKRVFHEEGCDQWRPVLVSMRLGI